ncbi:MAG: hypothetical protein OEM22_08635, partial [Acidimicrobiia bacterium]|nr:hypothetical protein [Acidimicrobiia bacterium]
MRLVMVLGVYVLVGSACVATSSEVSGDTSPVISLVSVPASDTPQGTTTTTPTLPTVQGTSLADVVAFVEADMAARFEVSDPPPGVIGPEQVTCSDAESTAAGFGDVFACLAELQTDGTVNMAAVGVVMVVVGDSGAARWLSGEEVPGNTEDLEDLFAPHAGMHLCRELAQGAPYPFNVGYLGAVVYWFLDGMPDRMDADQDGVPCETVFSFEEALDFWGGTAQEALLEDPRADFDFGFVTEVAADGSSLTIDFAEFLTGEEA